MVLELSIDREKTVNDERRLKDGTKRKADDGLFKTLRRKIETWKMQNRKETDDVTRGCAESSDTVRVSRQKAGAAFDTRKGEGKRGGQVK